ncbi:hypothetical protein [Neorhizobium petrolearium]|uniref:hypothetical protein n=1 Tax=Neorhizobium petrolearium TaxID=515361 RepID=UPI003F164445
MLSRRYFLSGQASSAIAIGMALRVVVEGLSVVALDENAFAGNGGGNGGGNRGGNGGSNSGNGSGGNANGNSNSNSRGSGSSVSAGKNFAGDTVSMSGSSIEGRHKTGIEESLANGRYTMRDRRGRTIISREATPANEARVRSMVRPSGGVDIRPSLSRDSGRTISPSAMIWSQSLVIVRGAHSHRAAARRGCKMIDLPRSTYYYRSTARTLNLRETELVAIIEDIQNELPAMDLGA